jgi:peptidoglycan/LPS O-acetylase OafA/YrhL
MLNPKERQALQSIERELQDSDPALANGLQGFMPVRRRPSLRRMLPVGAAVAMLLGVVGVILSQLTVGLVGMIVSCVTLCGYLIAVLRGRLRGDSHR